LKEIWTIIPISRTGTATVATAFCIPIVNYCQGVAHLHMQVISVALRPHHPSSPQCPTPTRDCSFSGKYAESIQCGANNFCMHLPGPDATIPPLLPCCSILQSVVIHNLRLAPKDVLCLSSSPRTSGRCVLLLVCALDTRGLICLNLRIAAVAFFAGTAPLGFKLGLKPIVMDRSWETFDFILHLYHRECIVGRLLHKV
jgi:hypothetical protein